MTSLSSYLCTHCEGAGLELHAAGQVICRYCGTANVLDGVICPQCEHISPAGAEVCGNCRLSLSRPCLQCGTRNWAGAETCRQCAASLDTVSRLSDRYGRVDPAARFREQQNSSREIKLEEEQASQRRMGELNAIEARRQANLGMSRDKKAAEQRVLLIGTATVVVIIIAATAISLVVSSLR